jgi:muconolactone delta-isomerase
MKYVIEFTTKANIDRSEFMRLVPAEGKRVHELNKQGIIEAPLLKKDKSGGYLVCEAKDEAQMHEALQSLPLYNFLDFKLEEVNNILI